MKRRARVEYYVGMIINDIKIIDIEDSKNKSLVKLKLKCLKCGRERVVSYKSLFEKVGKTSYHKYCAFSVGGTYPKSFKSSWANMRTRTTNDNYEKTKNYKLRGIDSNDFELFIDFYDAMFESYKDHVEKYGIENTTLERIDVDKGYSKENCRWVTWKEQADNKTSNREFTCYDPQGKQYSGKNIKKFCEENGLYYQTIIAGIHKRGKNGCTTIKFRNGWVFETGVTTNSRECRE